MPDSDHHSSLTPPPTGYPSELLALWGLLLDPRFDWTPAKVAEYVEATKRIHEILAS